jgi:hypothetical protein
MKLSARASNVWRRTLTDGRRRRAGDTIEFVVLELALTVTSDQALAECLRIPGRAGTLELNECRDDVWVTVHPLRDGGWATKLARELADLDGIRGEQHHAVVERPDVPVMFVRAADAQPSITHAWTELEEVVGSLRGRKFYGLFDPVGSEYRACVGLQSSDDPDALGLERGTLTGGRYVRERLRGEPPAVYALIAPAFQKLAQRADCDRQRPSPESTAAMTSSTSSSQSSEFLGAAGERCSRS